MYHRGRGVLALTVPPKTQTTASVKGPNVQRAFLLRAFIRQHSPLGPPAHPGGQAADE